MTTSSSKRRRGERCGLSMCVIECMEQRLLFNGGVQSTNVDLPNGDTTIFDNPTVVGNSIVFFPESALTLAVAQNDSSAYAGAIYNVSDGDLSPLAAPSSDVEDFSSAASVNQEALFTGGSDVASSGSSAQVDIYHLDSEQWSTANLSVPRTQMGAATVGQQVLFAGGYSGSGSGAAASTAVDIYNAQTDGWSTSALPYAAAPSGSFTIGQDAVFVDASHVQQYNASTEQWTAVALPAGFTPLNSLAIGNDVVMTAATLTDRYGVSRASNLAEVYDAATGTLNAVYLPRAATGLLGGVQGSLAYFLGVLTTAKSRHPAQDVAYRFSPAAERFISIAPPAVFVQPVEVGAVGQQMMFYTQGLAYFPESNPSYIGDDALNLSNGLWAGEVSAGAPVLASVAGQLIEAYHGTDAITGDTGITVLTVSS